MSVMRPAILLIELYQRLLSPLLGKRCRFYPTCSEYAKTAIDKHSPRLALTLITKRLLRCHPWCEGGFDPVP
ncbi:MAG: membrane protein insertion efficiency factor YidD [Myxococcota bacterium]